MDFFYQITLFTAGQNPFYHFVFLPISQYSLAVLVICARWELKQEAKKANQQDNVKVNPVEGASEANGRYSRGNGLAQLDGQLQGEEGKGCRKAVERAFNRFYELYIHLVTNFFSSVLLCTLWIVFLVICFNVGFVWGQKTQKEKLLFQALFKFEINLTTRKLFPPDSPLLEIENYREEKVGLDGRDNWIE